MILARQTIKISRLAHSTSKIIPRMIWGGPGDSFCSQGGAPDVVPPKKRFLGGHFFPMEGPRKMLITLPFGRFKRFA